MRKDFLVFGAPLIGNEEVKEIIDTLDSNWIGTGPRVKKFEQDFMKYKHASYAVAVNSCTAGLHLSLLASEIGPGDEVITTPLTFCATINAIIHCGAKPVLVDVNPETMNIDEDKIEEAISSRTKAILPVHFAGRSCNMTKLNDVAQKYGLDIIEDCAHAVETNYNGQQTGNFGRFGVFSFYATKNLVTGEGGMVLCRDEKDAERVRILSLHGMNNDAWKRYSNSGYRHYTVVEPGFKYNMTDLQAALGIHQLARIEKNHQRRAFIWQYYNEALSDLSLTLPIEPEANTRHAYHLYTILVDDKKIDRDKFIVEMTKRKIGVGVHFLSIAEHPYYQSTFNWKPELWPNAMDIGRRTVSLPLSASLSAIDIEDVVNAVRQLDRQ